MSQTRAFDVDAYESERLDLLRRGIFFAILIAAALLAVFSLLDHAMYPDVAGVLLRLRLVVTAILFALLGVSMRLRGRTATHLLALGTALLLGGTIDVMVALTGGAESRFYAGNNLLLLGLAVLLPWGPAWSLVASLLLLLFYTLAALPEGPAQLRAFVSAITYLASAGLVAVISSALSERLRRSEFQTRAELAKMANAKSEFLASVSHDLRTPLNVVMGYSELLADGTFGALNAAQADTVQRILGNARGQLELVNDLLDLARIEQGKLSCAPRPLALGELLPRLHDMMEVLLRDRPVRFIVDLQPELAVMADAERLQQVLHNLLTNAAKYTDYGEIRLSAERRAAAVSIAIADTGAGMEESFLSDALEPFVRGADPRGGWGLGLAIVGRLVDLMSGELDFDTAPGQGTTVRVILPAAHGAAAVFNASAEPDRDPAPSAAPELYDHSTRRLVELSPARQ